MEQHLTLKYVPPSELTLEDAQWLEKANFAGPDFEKIPMLQVEHHLKQGTMHLFRFVPGPGVLLTEVLSSPSGIRRLSLIRSAGRGAGWTFPQLAALLQHTAKEWGCEGVETMVYSGRLAMAMKKVGARAESVKMFLPVKGE